MSTPTIQRTLDCAHQIKSPSIMSRTTNPWAHQLKSAPARSPSRTRMTKAWTMTQNMTTTTNILPQPQGTVTDVVFTGVLLPPGRLVQQRSAPKGPRRLLFPPKTQTRSRRKMSEPKFRLLHLPATIRHALIVRHGFRPTPRSRSMSYPPTLGHSFAPSSVTAATPLLAARTNGSGTSTSNISTSRRGDATSMLARSLPPPQTASAVRKSVELARRHPRCRRQWGRRRTPVRCSTTTSTARTCLHSISSACMRLLIRLRLRRGMLSKGEFRPCRSGATGNCGVLHRGAGVFTARTRSSKGPAAGRTGSNTWVSIWRRTT